MLAIHWQTSRAYCRVVIGRSRPRQPCDARLGERQRTAGPMRTSPMEPYLACVLHRDLVGGYAGVELGHGQHVGEG